MLPLFAHRPEVAEKRAGRGAVQLARRCGVLIEELTDREQSVPRALTAAATQREIGALLYLSINTVKGYTKVLYRKLGVATRQDAVRGALPQPDLTRRQPRMCPLPAHPHEPHSIRLAVSDSLPSSHPLTSFNSTSLPKPTNISHHTTSRP